MPLTSLRNRSLRCSCRPRRRRGLCRGHYGDCDSDTILPLAFVVAVSTVAIVSAVATLSAVGAVDGEVTKGSTVLFVRATASASVAARACGRKERSVTAWTRKSAPQSPSLAFAYNSPLAVASSSSSSSPDAERLRKTPFRSAVRDTAGTPATRLLMSQRPTPSSSSSSSSSSPPPSSTSLSSSTSSTSLYYRDRQQHEERYAPADTTSAAAEAAKRWLSAWMRKREGSGDADTKRQNESGADWPLIRGLCQSQVQVFAGATAVAAVVVMFASLVAPSSTSAAASSMPLPSLEALAHCAIAWTGAATATTASPPASIWAWRVAQGVLGSLPMIFLGNRIEQSHSRNANYINFATTNMVITMFGKRKSSDSLGPNKDHQGDRRPQEQRTTSTLEVLWYSTLLSLVTGVSEEIVFRGYIPAALRFFLSSLHHLPLLGPVLTTGAVVCVVWVLQALVFGLGHYHDDCTQPGENEVVVAFQTFNGLWYGLLYAIVARGDIIPCIIAHVMYDAHVLVSTWHRVNNQIQYIEKRCSADTAGAISSAAAAATVGLASSGRQDNSDADAVMLMDLRRESGHSLTRETIDSCQHYYYAFDSEHVGSLSLPDVQRAISYAFLQEPCGESIPTEVDVRDVFHSMHNKQQQQLYDKLQQSSVNQEEPRLRLAYFMRLLFTLRSKSIEIKQRQQQQQDSSTVSASAGLPNGSTVAMTPNDQTGGAHLTDASHHSML